MTTLTVTVDTALAAYSLTREDLPGIAEAWDIRFADLALPLPETDVQVLCRLRPHLGEWEDVSVDSVAPRSDGTLAVELEGHIEEDGDSMYTCSREELTAEEAQQFLRARESNAERRRLSALRYDAERTVIGARPVWWLLAPEPHPQIRYENAVRVRHSAQQHLRGVEEYLRCVEQLQAVLETHTPISAEEEKKFPFAGGYARGVKPYGAAGTGLRDQDIARVDIVNRIARALAEHTPKLAYLQEAMDAAQALPEGALRDFLIGEREPRTYNATVGNGRGKKTLKRTYTPTSDLVRDYNSAREAHGRAATDAKEKLRLLAKFHADAAARLQDAHARLVEEEVEVARVWAEGWPGEAVPAPVKLDDGPDW